MEITIDDPKTYVKQLATERLSTKRPPTHPLAADPRASPSARGRMGQQNEQLHSPPRRGGEPPGAKRGGRGSVRRLFCAEPNRTCVVMATHVRLGSAQKS